MENEIYRREFFIQRDDLQITLILTREVNCLLIWVQFNDFPLRNVFYAGRKDQSQAIDFVARHVDILVRTMKYDDYVIKEDSRTTTYDIDRLVKELKSFSMAYL